MRKSITILFLAAILFFQCQAINLKSVINPKNKLRTVSILSGLIGATHAALGFISLYALRNSLKKKIEDEDKDKKLMGIEFLKEANKMSNPSAFALGVPLTIAEIAVRSVPILGKIILLQGLMLYSMAIGVPAITISAITGYKSTTT